MKKAESKDRIKEILQLKEMSQADLCRLTGFEKGRVSAWLKGKYQPRQRALTILSEALGVQEAWLMGYDVPMQKETQTFAPEPLSMKQVPLLGNIACGTPILANQHEGESRLVAGNASVDFCLIAKGNSMIDANIDDGDIIFCHKQETVENGEIAAVLIDDGADYAEATLKRIYFYPQQNRIILVAENPEVPALTFAGEQLKKVRILGKAVICQKQL